MEKWNEAKVKKIDSIYLELRKKGYEINEATRFFKNCGISIDKNPKNIPTKVLNECLREAKKERRIY